MKHRSTQFGVRKNPDSARVHGLRLAMNSPSTSDTQTRDSQVGGSSSAVPSTSEELHLPLEDSTNGTTVREGRDQGQLHIQLERRPRQRFVSEALEIHGYDSDRDEYKHGKIFHRHTEAL
jgi:hypothetical protein